MGNFYANISLRTQNRDLVVETLRELRRVAFVSHSTNRWLVVYDRDIETAEPEDVGELAAHLSSVCGSIAVPVSDYDDDILWFRVYDSGRLIDEYNSAPAYFQGTQSIPEGGSEQALVAIFKVVEAEKQVKEILHEREYAVQIERHAALAEILGLPRISVGFGYRYLERGELPTDLLRDDLTHID